jgi:DNA-nicking Smr family endonuclease
VSDDQLWQDFVNRYGPGGKGDPPEPEKPTAKPAGRPAPRGKPADRSLTADDTDAWNSFLTDYSTETVALNLPPRQEEVPESAPRPPKPDRRDRTDYDRRIDLHGLTRRAAKELLDQRLFEARLMGLENLLVITGRGLHSDVGPVLKLWLPEWAARQADGAPLRCEEADAKIGGPGAFLVWV